LNTPFILDICHLHNYFSGRFLSRLLRAFIESHICSVVVIYINLCVKVEEHYIRAIEIYESSLGASDTNVAKTKNNLVRFTGSLSVVLLLCSDCLFCMLISLCIFRFYLFRLRNIISVH